MIIQEVKRFFCELAAQLSEKYRRMCDLEQ